MVALVTVVGSTQPLLNGRVGVRGDDGTRRDGWQHPRENLNPPLALTPQGVAYKRLVGTRWGGIPFPLLYYVGLL